VAERAKPLYHCLTFGTGNLYGQLVALQPFSDQLLDIGYQGDKAALAAYLQLICQQMWVGHLAFESDPAIERHIGQEFSPFREGDALRPRLWLPAIRTALAARCLSLSK